MADSSGLLEGILPVTIRFFLLPILLVIVPVQGSNLNLSLWRRMKWSVYDVLKPSGPENILSNVK